jgi:hypothetical protein
MTALDSLPADQRAVVELVLARGRDYDEIARLLSIDRAGVRQRALSALDTLGADTDVPAPRRALITDYLLGQLPGRVAEDVAARLDREPAEAAWARTVAGALAPIAAEPLPSVGTRAGRNGNGAETTAEPVAADTPPEFAPVATAAPTTGPADTHSADTPPAGIPPAEETASAPRRRPSSRRGGVVVLALGLVALIAVIVIIIAAVSGGGSSGSKSSHTAAATSSTTPTTATNAMRLTPVAKGSKAQGIAEAFKQSGTEYLAVVAINLPANSTKTGSRNYYAVWLTGAAGASKLLGFAPPVTSNGQLRAATKLTSAEAKYTKILVTLETAAHPTQPGPLVLSGAFNYSVK